MIGHGLFRNDMGFTGNPITDFLVNSTSQGSPRATLPGSQFTPYFAKDKIERQVQIIKERHQFSHGGKKKRKRKGR